MGASEMSICVLSSMSLCRRLFLSRHQFSLSPQKLLLLQFAWIVPYLLTANYLERSLLPLRLMCYTQSDLLSTRPLASPFSTCIRKLFGGRQPEPGCNLRDFPGILIRPRIHGTPRQVVVVRTAPGSIDYRTFIRNTWKQKVESFAPVIFVCATGQPLHEEAAREGDVLLFDFPDSYYGLSRKMTSIYSWILKELPHVENIIVVNDDTIVNGTALFNIPVGNPDDSWIIGKVSRGYPRLFMPWLPWHIPGWMYPNLCYPRFTQGSSFILSRGGARSIVDHACSIPFVRLDDVWMGALMNCLSVDLLHHDGFDHHLPDSFVVFHYQYSRYSAEYLQQLFHSFHFS